jgi:hypothetical protein
MSTYKRHPNDYLLDVSGRFYCSRAARSRRLADGQWYGKLVAVDVGHRKLTFAPACRLSSERWTAVADGSREQFTATVVRHPDLEIYYRPSNAAAGHVQSADLALLADVASHGRFPDSPPGWFVTMRGGAAVSVQEDSGIRSSGEADRRTFACVWSCGTQAFVSR